MSEHHPSCRDSDRNLVWHCSQCGLNESAADIEGQLAAERRKREEEGAEFSNISARAIQLQQQLADERERFKAAQTALQMNAPTIVRLQEQLDALVDALKLLRSKAQSEDWSERMDVIDAALAKLTDQHQHEYDICVGPPNDPRLGKRICNFCGELEPAQDQPVQLPMINDDPVVSLK